MNYLKCFIEILNKKKRNLHQPLYVILIQNLTLLFHVDFNYTLSDVDTPCSIQRYFLQSQDGFETTSLDFLFLN